MIDSRSFHLVRNVSRPRCMEEGGGGGAGLPAARTGFDASADGSLPPRWMSFRAAPPTLCQRRGINSALITPTIFLPGGSGGGGGGPQITAGPRCLIEFPSAVCAVLSADQRCGELRLRGPDPVGEDPGTRRRRGGEGGRHRSVRGAETFMTTYGKNITGN